MASFFEEFSKKKDKKDRKKKNLVLNVDISAVEKQYGLPASRIEKKTKEEQPHTHQPDTFQQSTLSGAKKTRTLFIQSVDGNLKPLENKTDIWCYWCVHPFASHPIGCPIKHYLNENGDSVYETVNVFCDFACMQAHINFVKKYNIDDHLYKESLTLAIQMYIDVFGIMPPKGVISAANDKKLLKVFGGTYEIDDFRKLNESFAISATNIRTRMFPPMITSSEIFEKHCVFSTV